MRSPSKLDLAVGDLSVFDLSSPEMALRVVVLPAPLLPRTVTIWPSVTFSDIPFSTRMTLW